MKKNISHNKKSKVLPTIKFQYIAVLMFGLIWGYIGPLFGTKAAVAADCWYSNKNPGCDVHPDVLMVGACLAAIIAMFTIVITLRERGYEAYSTFLAFFTTSLGSIYSIIIAVDNELRTVELLALPVFLYIIFVIGFVLPFIFFPLRKHASLLKKLNQQSIGTLLSGFIAGGIWQFISWKFWQYALIKPIDLGNFIVAPFALIPACAFWVSIITYGEKELTGNVRKTWQCLFLSIIVIATITYGVVFAEKYALHINNSIVHYTLAIALSSLLIIPAFVASYYYIHKIKQNQCFLLLSLKIFGICCISNFIAAYLIENDLNFTEKVIFITIQAISAVLVFLCTNFGRNLIWFFQYPDRLDKT